jgi:hypothetical protein
MGLKSKGNGALMGCGGVAARHLKDLLRDSERSDALFFEHNGILADFSRQRVTVDKTLPVRICQAFWFVSCLVLG